MPQFIPLSTFTVLALALGGPKTPIYAADALKPFEKPQNPQLVFKTGFEGDSRVVPYSESDNEMIGRDPAQKSDIQADLGIEHFELQYTGGDASKRFAEIIPEPGNPQNHVLHFWLNEAYPASEGQVKARVQANIYGLKTGYKEFYQSQRVYLHPDFAALRKYPQPIYWLTLAEFWNNIFWGGKNGARVTFGVGKVAAGESDLNFVLNAEGPGTRRIWNAHNDAVKVPIGHWFTMDYYLKEGDAQNGRVYMAITPDGGPRQVVFDAQGWTYCPTDPAPDGFTDWNPLKLYTSKEVVGFVKAQNKTLQIYWDDLEIWKNRRPTDSTPTPAPLAAH